MLSAGAKLVAATLHFCLECGGQQCLRTKREICATREKMKEVAITHRHNEVSTGLQVCTLAF